MCVIVRISLLLVVSRGGVILGFFCEMKTTLDNKYIDYTLSNIFSIVQVFMHWIVSRFVPTLLFEDP